MILNHLWAWAQTATASDRADAASALARAYLYCDLDEPQRRDAISVLTAFLDDPVPMVRRVMAEAFASAAEAPHHIVLALAEDQSSIAAIVLSRSPVLSDAALIDCVATADGYAQSAVASRADLSKPVAAALAETAGPEALQVLAYNLSAPLPEFSLRRILERYGDNADVREALLSRKDLPVSVRMDLVTATTRALSGFVSEQNWMSDERVLRVAREEKDKAAIFICETAVHHGSVLAMVAHLRATSQLSVGLALRAILSGRVDIFKTILAELSGTTVARAHSLTEQAMSGGFAALYRKASLPAELLPAFRIALRAVAELDAPSRAIGLSRTAVLRTLTSCEQINDGSLDKLLVLLRRFEGEAARDEARAMPTQVQTPLVLTPLDAEPEAPLMLTDLDADGDGRHSPRSRDARHAVSVPVAVDLAALETELLAA